MILAVIPARGGSKGIPGKNDKRFVWTAIDFLYDSGST